MEFRLQYDGKQDIYSEGTGLGCDPDEDVTRQEFKDECDVNKILSRLGALPPSRPVHFGGDVDFDVDLLSAYEAVQRAREAYDALSPKIRAQYRDWQTLAADLVSGKLPEEAPPSPGGTTEGLGPEGGPPAPPAGEAKPAGASPA